MYRYLLLAALLVGCGVGRAGEAPLDMGSHVDAHPELCQTAADEGKEIWWTFLPDYDVNLLTDKPAPRPLTRYSSRYVCKNHGKERHGRWWEQER